MLFSKQGMDEDPMPGPATTGVINIEPAPSAKSAFRAIGPVDLQSTKGVREPTRAPLLKSCPVGPYRVE
jgi:hypothetical protein